MLRDPPHYLKPLKTTRTPTRLAWLACKGATRRVRDTYEQRFIAGAVGTTHYTSRKGVRKDTMQAFTEPRALWDFIDGYCVANRRTVLFGYDLAEQIRLSQLFTSLPMSGWSLDKIVMDRTAAWCSLRNEKRALLCCDLKSWAPVSWEKIVSDIDGGRAAKAATSLGGYHFADVCIVQAAYIRAAVMQILDWIEGENLGPFRPTGSGQSYSAYRRRFITSRLLVHDDIPRLGAERTAMHTGRCEAWKHGALRGGPYLEYDLHAAYATIGYDCDVPTVALPGRERTSPLQMARIMDRNAVLADVTVTTEVECVPCTINGRTLWPVGRFRTQLWDPELRLALDLAKRVEVHACYPYRKEPALREFCDYVLSGLDGQTQVYGLVPARVLKHWSRCLVGRLGLRYRLWHKFGEQDPPDVRLVTFLDLDEGTRTEMLLAGGQRLLLGDLEEAPESLPQVPGWVMSQARANLWREMQAFRDSLVYVDTDSLIVDESKCKLLLGRSSFRTDAGEWRIKGVYDRIVVHGPRNLAIGNDRRIAGVPLAARTVAPLHFEGEVTQSMRTSLQSSNPDAIVSLPRSFHVLPKDLRRQHSPDGSTFPYRLEQ